jgi:molybdate transport system substrate-binding protein
MQTTSSPLRGISSMATKALLAKLCAEYATRASQSVEIESVGGVDAAKRVQAGEAMDVVLLASDAIERLIASGHVQPGSRVDWVQSPVALAVPLGATAPDISTPDALKLALLAAPSISYSTGPSGNYLAKLFEQWGIAELMKTKLIVPPCQALPWWATCLKVRRSSLLSQQASPWAYRQSASMRCRRFWIF